MKKKKGSELVCAYVRQYYPFVLMFVVFAGIFALVFSMYDLNTEAVLYAVFLCMLVLIPVVIVHFLHYVRRHQERCFLDKQLTISTESFPKAESLLEEEYQQMLLHIREKLDRTVSEWQKEKQEHMDYYTTWVHQIKTPISVMRMLLKEQDTKGYRELSDEVFRVEQYVEMVLSYLRLGSEQSDYIIREYDLNEIIRQAIHKYASQFIRKKIRLRYEPVKCYVLTDEKWLLFIIEQLFSNAVKYTPGGEVTITVTEEMVLQIADTGIGIAPEDLPRIFEKGFTGYNGHANKKSTGLGLYLCKLASEKLSHHIWAESVPGKGTVFFLDLHHDFLEIK